MPVLLIVIVYVNETVFKDKIVCIYKHILCDIILCLLY